MELSWGQIRQNGAKSGELNKDVDVDKELKVETEYGDENGSL